MSNTVKALIKREGNLRDYFFKSPKVGFEHYSNDEIKLVINNEPVLVFKPNTDTPNVNYDTTFDISELANKIVAVHTLMKTLSDVERSESTLIITFIWQEYEITWGIKDGFVRKVISVEQGRVKDDTPLIYLRAKDELWSTQVYFGSGKIGDRFEHVSAEIITVDKNALNDKAIANVAFGNLYRTLYVPMFRASDYETLVTMFSYFDNDIAVRKNTHPEMLEPEERFVPIVHVKLNLSHEFYKEILAEQGDKMSHRFNGIKLLFREISIDEDHIKLTAKVGSTFGLLNLLKLVEWLNARSIAPFYAEEITFEFQNTFGITTLRFYREFDPTPFDIAHQSWSSTHHATYWVFDSKLTLLKEHEVTNPEWQPVGELMNDNRTVISLGIPEPSTRLEPLHPKYCFIAKGKDAHLFFTLVELILMAFGYEKYGFKQFDMVYD